MIKYKTENYGVKIKPIETTKETEKSVWFLINNREYHKLKRTDSHIYWDTFEQAKQHLIERAERKIESYKDQLSRAKDDLANAYLLTPQ